MRRENGPKAGEEMEVWRGTDDRGMGEKMRDEWMTSDEARDDVLKRRRDMRDAFGRLEGRRDGAWRVIDRLRRGRAFAWSGGRPARSGLGICEIERRGRVARV